MMDHVLASEMFIAFAYIKDVIMFGCSETEIIECTFHVLKLSKEDALKLGSLKCYFLLRKLSLLGRTVQAGCKYPEDDKLQDLRDLVLPTT